MDFDEAGTSKQAKPYVVPFREEWAKLFPWLEKEKDGKGKKCTLCRVPIIGGVAHIKRHASRDAHVKNMNATKTTPKINNFLTIAARCPVAESARKLEIMLSAFVAEHNIPFATLDHLNHIIKNGINDSQITKKFNIYRQKGQQIVTNLTGPENTTSISKFCQNNYYSLVIDESTDCSISKNLAIVIRTFDGQCRDRFLGMVQLEDSTANGIYESTIKALREKNIPIQNMVGITTDNCAVMMGSQNGVQIKFKNLVPQLFSNGCICHILNLASVAAAKLGIPNEIDKFIRDINYYFCNSASRRVDFVKFQEYFGADIHIIFKYATTRWLSRQEVVDRIVEQWEPLQYYFTLENFEEDVRNEKLFYN
ncbi:zinc finger MYM-type protein 6-like [Calliphora vicina]|uniref:zinc finger MYM-type protein 6-like n=1 Tax=Calliphora vicina TaxID=7373 RepID=UPI00325C117E